MPELGTQNDDAARRFINLVDEFYDRNVKLIITAAKPVESFTAAATYHLSLNVLKVEL